MKIKKKLLMPLLLATVSLPSLAGMTATYTGSPFSTGGTSSDAITATFTFKDDFRPTLGLWATYNDVSSFSVGLTSGRTVVPWNLWAMFYFDNSGNIQDWWFSVAEYKSSPA